MARRKKDEVLRTGEVTVEIGDKVYTAAYEVLKGGFVRIETGKSAHIGGLTEKGLARLLLNEEIDYGHADQWELGRPKTGAS